MPKTKVTNALERALFDVLIEKELLLDKEKGKLTRNFKKHWGSFDPDALKHALQEGGEQERLFALFALGYLMYEEAKEFLVPFLSSPVSKEQWASVIVLGEQKEERAFALLGQLLTEGMEYHSLAVDEKEVMNSVFQAYTQAREQFGTPKAWERLVSPDLVQIWNKMQAYRDEYMWYMKHRERIIRILGAWNDSRAIPILRQALQTCWQIEQHPTPQGGILPEYLRESFHQLEDTLAYTLGQLEAWDALDGLDTAGLPPSRFKLARMFLVFGSLQVNLQQMSHGNLKMLIALGAIDPNRVINVLQERFGLNEYLARANLQVFQEWYQERDEYWQWQRRIVRGEI
jgi:hypothetical protein